MAYEIEFFGHCQEDNHDKIWGYATVQGDEVYSFWGRRGGKLAFKRFRGNTSSVRAELGQKEREKARKGYRWIGTTAMIEAICPGFISAFENELFLAKMSEEFRVDDLSEEA
jgi:predicted DNA-binding WGR domain protein